MHPIKVSVTVRVDRVYKGDGVVGALFITMVNPPQSDITQDSRLLVLN